MTRGALRIARTRTELAAARAAAAGPVGVVMTMGALHEGHAALLRAARARAATLVATIFVNPLQFGPTEDLARYPRTEAADLELCRDEGVDIAFVPAREEIYPHGEPAVRVDPGPLGDVLEGASRPGHFSGVLTVVHKLLQLTGADIAWFGDKDFQQLTLVQAMVRDLDLPVRIESVPTVREPDGLARSSRNRYLSTAQRRAAGALPAALAAAAEAAEAGGTPEKVLAAATAMLAGVDVDYAVLTDGQLRPLIGPEAAPPADGTARLLVAARFGNTRLIDNTPVSLTPR